MGDPFALVLGSGGIVGVAWTFGLLAELLDRNVIDAREAQVFVGTSAGAVVAAQLAAGADPRELLAAPSSSADRDLNRYFDGVDQQVALELFLAWSGTQPMTIEIAKRIGELASRATAKDPEEWIARTTERFPPVSWHGSRLRLVAVSATTGERVVWDGGSGVPVERAIAASSAVPGLVPPIPIGEDRFVDGGLWSSTNADLVLDAPAETVIVTCPQTRLALLRGASVRALEEERSRLEAAGKRVIVLTPGEAFEDLAARSMSAAVQEPAIALGRDDASAAADTLAAAGIGRASGSRDVETL